MFTSTLVSGLQRSVMLALINMGISHRSDAVSANGCIKIDLAFDYLGNDIALEVNPVAAACCLCSSLGITEPSVPQHLSSIMGRGGTADLLGAPEGPCPSREPASTCISCSATRHRRVSLSNQFHHVMPRSHHRWCL